VGRRGVDDLGVGVDDLVHPLDRGAGQLRVDHQGGQDARNSGQRSYVGGEGQEGADGELPAQGEDPADRDDTHEPELRQCGEGGSEPGVHPGHPQPLGVEPPRRAFQLGHGALLLAEALDHPYPRHGLLDVLRDVARSLLGRPGGREQRAPGDRGSHPHHGRHHQRHHAEHGGEVDHGGQGDQQQQRGARGEWHHGQQALHQL